MQPGLAVLELVNVMVERLKRNYGAVLVVLAALMLAGAGFGWIISEIDGVRDDVSVEINVVKEDVSGQITGVRGEINGFREGASDQIVDVQGEVNAFRGDLSGDVADVRGEVAELRGEVALLREEVTVLRKEVTAVREEVAALRGEVRGLRQDLADTERRLTEKWQATDARVAGVEQSLLLMNAKIDAFLEAIANHSHTEDGEVIFGSPAVETPGDGAPDDAEADADAAGVPDNRTLVPATAR